MVGFCSAEEYEQLKQNPDALAAKAESYYGQIISELQLQVAKENDGAQQSYTAFDQKFMTASDENMELLKENQLLKKERECQAEELVKEKGAFHQLKTQAVLDLS